MSNATRETGLQLLGEAEYDAQVLWERFPPKLTHAGKRILFEAAGGSARVPTGVVRVARYAPRQVPPTFPERHLEVRTSDSAYSYPAPETSTTEWHVNFANTHLFCAYGAAAFAQDELQVAEHPVLGSLLEALIAETRPGLAPLTVEAGAPTPILVRGAERWCAIDTDPELAMPFGIYGQRFRKAKAEAIRQAVTRLDGSYRSNLVAMEAPTGSGSYTEAQVRGILETAWTGFAAVRHETESTTRVVVHTGHWGTGAYGGNRIVMAALQILAARLAHLDRLVYHSVGNDGIDAYQAAVRIVDGLPLGATSGVSGALDAIVKLGFSWGVSDGN